MQSNFVRAFSTFRNLRILVVGDIMLDRYLKGKVSRISPEAPVPVLLYEGTEDGLGGAGNVALNLQTMEVKTHIASLVGSDTDGDRITELLRQAEIGTECLLADSNRITTLKTRVVAANQQLLRVDREDLNDINPDQESELLLRINELMSQYHFDVVIMEDYNKGLFTPKMITGIIDLARSADSLTCVDPKARNFLMYRHVDLFKPNLLELRSNVPMEVNLDKESLNKACHYLLEKLDCRRVMVTLSESGIFIADQNNSAWIKGHKRAISDVSGAGDTVISIAALGLATGLRLKEIASLANLAGGIVCEYPGVVPVKLERLKEECFQLEEN
jgi:rfaE bifunctional protein kinase chain/domain